ncbi:MAG: baseplate J/gp47 family protein [Hyphomicrobiaceae bacterium]|nr:baseplate J/gp47 family protein [Hyphomicrobiaceae bacterium]
MSNALTKALPGLSEPAILEDLDFEALLARRKELVVQRGNQLGLNLRDYIDQPFEVGNILLEDASHEDMLLGNRINQVYRSRLLYFATGGDLDHVAEDYGVTRLAGEEDEDLRTRVRIHNRGSSSAGPDDWWRFHAMKADERVEDVAVTRVLIGPQNQQRGLVELAVLAQTSDGIPSNEILANVLAVVSCSSVRPVGSSVRVVAATSKPFDVKARIWLLPGVDKTVFSGLETRLRQAFSQVRALGFDIAPSWICAQLQAPGVQRVKLVGFDEPLRVAMTAAPRLDNIILEFAGYDR